MCLAFSNSESPSFCGPFSGRTSRRLPKIVIVNDHYFNINDDSWRRYGAFGCIDVSPEGAGDFQGTGGDGRLSTTNNRAEDVARREGARRGLNTLISKIINYYQQK